MSQKINTSLFSISFLLCKYVFLLSLPVLILAYLPLLSRPVCLFHLFSVVHVFISFIFYRPAFLFPISRLVCSEYFYVHVFCILLYSVSDISTSLRSEYIYIYIYFLCIDFIFLYRNINVHLSFLSWQNSYRKTEMKF